MSDRQAILLVDDEPFILTAASRLLSDAGFEVHTCHLWSKVVALIHDVQPDLVMLDYNMPWLKGDDICIVLRRNIINADMKIVLFSSEEESVLAGVTVACGADGYIRKNRPGPEILVSVCELLGQDVILPAESPLEASYDTYSST